MSVFIDSGYAQFPARKGLPAFFNPCGGSMKKCRITIHLAMFLILMAGCADFMLSPAHSADEATELKARYEKLLADYSQIVLHPTNKSPSATEYAVKNNMVSKELAGLLRKDDDLARKEGGMGYLDFDFLINGQDLCKPVKIVGVAKANATYAIQVSNRIKECCSDCNEIPYSFVMVNESGVWKIDDALYAFKDDAGTVQKFTLKDILNGKVD
jgi:hypothetical protein